MTLLLRIEWTPDATAVSVVDIAAGQLLTEASGTHHPAGDGHDVDRWLRSTIDATRATLDSLVVIGPSASDIRAVHIVSSSPGGLIAIDADGAPLHDALLGTHGGSAPDADWLLTHAEGGADAWLAATGVAPSAGSTVALLSYLHRTDPEVWAAMERCTLPVGLLTERLGGRPAIGATAAVGTAVADRRAPHTWCTDLLGIVDADRDWLATMPAIVDDATPIGVLDATVADAMGVPAGRPLHVGAGLGA